MQPTLPQSAGAADMDLPAVQSMDWLFKKERIYLLAQFWQQRATLAEKEVNTLKEQLSSTTISTSNSSAAVTTKQNGGNSIATHPLASPTMSDCSGSGAGINNTVMARRRPEEGQTTVDENKMLESNDEQQNSISGRFTPVSMIDKNEAINNVDDDRERDDDDDDDDDDVEMTLPATVSTTSLAHTTSSVTNSIIGSTTMTAISGTASNGLNTLTTTTKSTNYSNDIDAGCDDTAAKDKEIVALVEEISRLRSALAALQESHNLRIQQLEERLEAKRQHISRLEARLDKQSEYDDVKKENSTLRSVDVSAESKQFQELLLERTKALAAQTEALKSASSDGTTFSGVTTPLQNHAITNSNQSHNQHPLSSPSPTTPVHTPASTPISGASTAISNGCTNAVAGAQQQLNAMAGSGLLPPPLQNVETFGSFLGEEIVSSWRRGLELPPPPNVASFIEPTQYLISGGCTETQHALRLPNKKQHLHHHPQQQDDHHHHQQQQHHQSHNRHLDDKSSSHHDASSTASTPILQDTRFDDNHNGGITPMSLPISKSPQEDNNNHLGSLPHGPASFPLGLSFHVQDRAHYRFADDLQMPPGSMAGRLGDSLIPKGDPMEAKLQEMLRYNMDKYANQNLDTLHISRRVRELLSVHNIGQRLFAKYVLGLSQGTVSELLSKPKPWDKLTEKGRDSYRKMHAWACDDNAVLLLKSLIPKKDSDKITGSDAGLPSFGRGDDNGMADDRIAHILTEASNMMKPSIVGGQTQQQQSHDDSHSNDDSDSPHNQCPSPFSKDSQNRRLRKYDNDDISHEKVARIYQEELAKLMSRAPRDAFPSGGMPPAAPSATPQLPDENIRMALEAYYRELAKLQQSGGSLPNFPNLPGLIALQQQAVLNGAQDLSVKKEQQQQLQQEQQQQQHLQQLQQQQPHQPIKINGQHSLNVDEQQSQPSPSSAFSLVRPKPEPGTTPTTTASSAAPSPLGNSILPPAMTPTDDFSSAASPLQRMASITNSLITQSPVANHHNSPQRPLKAVLPPITQQQFDMFNNLNTEDIVRRVKEALSQYSISQRLFGESVLGLSQGSVSDLLARPKPWHMLTQKGREPFIRMKMFLEDDNAVHKLVASQYKIAPEKLMRTGSYSGTPQIPSGIAKQMPPMQKMMNEMSKMQQEQHLLHLQQMQMPSPQQQSVAQVSMQQSTGQQPSQAPSQQTGMLLTPPGLPPHHRVPIPQEDKKPMPMPVHSPQQSNAMRGLHQHMSPTVYEMAALTQDLDTQIITTKIKEALLANNIGQKIFGEAVLGLSQGSVSELLSKPKPWHMLSIKGREPFIRMQLWLSDANNVDRLQALKNERREANKRRRSTGPGLQDNSSDTSSNDTSEFYTSNSPGPGSVGSTGAPPNKKQRVLFSEEQKEALRLAFALDPYPNVATIEFLATELALSTRTITNWFHNHRMRLKQQVPHGAPSEPVPSRENQSGAPFDPVQFRLLLNQRLMELQKERMGLSGVPLPYPPYFAANPNLAALIGRGLLPTNEADLAALNNAFKEQLSGLDLSMGGSLKRERDEFSDDEADGDGEMASCDDMMMMKTQLANMKRNESIVIPHEANNVSDVDGDDDDNVDNDLSAAALAIQASSRTSRRKPAAPQWVNPVWQDDKKPANTNITGRTPAEDEIIINGVCVMQQATDYSRDEETVRIEPQAVHDRFDEDTSVRSDDEENNSIHKENDDEASKDSRKEMNELNEVGETANKHDFNADDNAALIVKKEIDEWDN